MSKQSQYAKSLFLRYLHHHHIPKPPISPTQTLTPNHQWAPHFSTYSSSKLLLKETNLNRAYIGFRYISTATSKNGGNNIKDKLKDPVGGVKKAFSRYRQAVGLQIEAFWRRNSMVLVGAGAVFVCVLLWRVMFGIANTFIGFSEGMAKYGFLALSTAIVAFTGLYLRSRFTINPDKVYRMAMRKLNTSADILEVMGAPLTGTDLRAYVMSGGGVTLKNFKAGLRSKRCFLIFPIRGSEMKGLVSVEVKNKKGQYDMKLLSVDLPMAAGPDQRLFLIGDEEEYRVGGGLISELRDPVVRAMAAAKEFEARDLEEDKEDAERELEEAERKHREEVEKLEKQS
nr:extensin like [Tanacetum cinerariifolium]